MMKILITMHQFWNRVHFSHLLKCVAINTAYEHQRNGVLIDINLLVLPFGDTLPLITGSARHRT